jgi:hypothetical protein
MEIYEPTSATSNVLNEQVARLIFGLLPEQGPVMVIMDKLGNCWPSDAERFQGLNIEESLLRELCEKIDDGNEPVITQLDGASIVAAQLATDLPLPRSWLRQEAAGQDAAARHTNCGYVMIALPQYSPESTLANIDLIEILLSQAGLIARLIETNEHLHELQTKQWEMYRQCEVPTS